MALLAGRSPYARTTYLGNTRHHLPGAFLLASPFVLLGTSALQSLLWVSKFFLAVGHEADGDTALLLVWLVLVLSPASPRFHFKNVRVRQPVPKVSVRDQLGTA